MLHLCLPFSPRMSLVKVKQGPIAFKRSKREQKNRHKNLHSYQLQLLSMEFEVNDAKSR